MSEFPDPDFTALRNMVRARQRGVDLETVERAEASETRAVEGEATGDRHVHNMGRLADIQQETGRAAMQAHASATGADEAVQLIEHWESAAPRNSDIDAADAVKAQALRAMEVAEKHGTTAERVSTHAAAVAASQHASLLRTQRIQADEAFDAGMTALAAKVQQQTAASRSFIGDEDVFGTLKPDTIGSLKPPATAPRTPGTGTPAAPRTPVGAAPSTPAGTAPRTDLSKSAMPPMPQVPQGQAQPQQPQAQQQPHPQAAAAGGAPTGTPTAKPADRKRDSGDSAPTGLSAAVGAAGAGASPVSSAAAPRPTNPGYSVTGMQTATNVTGRPAPGVSLSAGMPTTAPATAAGTAAAPGGMGTPMVPPVGMGAGKGGAAKDAKTVVQSSGEPLEDGIVRGGTVCRGDATPEQKAS